jgi:hypothetical protein
MPESIRVYYRHVDLPGVHDIPLPTGAGGMAPTKPVFHKFIIYTNSEGRQYYIGAFPEKEGSGLSTFANRVDPFDSNSFNTGRGKIKPFFGEWNAENRSRESNVNLVDLPYETIATGDNLLAKYAYMVGITVGITVTVYLTPKLLQFPFPLDTPRHGEAQ